MDPIEDSIYKNPIVAINNWIVTQNQNWLKYLGNKIIEVKRELIDSEIEEMYNLFLQENSLSQKISNYENNTKSIIVTYKSSESNVFKEIKLVSLSDITGVNALVANQKIVFHSNLTVIYGNNAVGKSGYVRIFKRASNSRTKEEIWDNIYNIKQKNVCHAKFILKLDQSECEVEWNGETNLFPLTLIEVFDNKCVKVHLNDKLKFNFNPYGFEYFSFLSLAIAKIKDKLMHSITINDQLIDYSLSYKEGTKVFQFIKNINVNTRIDEIEKLAVFSESDKEELKSLEKNKKDIETVNLQDKIKIIDYEIKIFSNLKEVLEKISKIFRIEKYNNLKSFIDEYNKLNSIIKTKQNSDFVKYNIPSRDTKEWRDFIEKAEKYINSLSNHEKYPQDKDKCIYCRQDLLNESMDLVKMYRGIFLNVEINSLEKIKTAIDKSIYYLKEESFKYKNEDLDNIKIRIENYESGLSSNIKNLLNKADETRMKMIEHLSNIKWADIDFIFDESILIKINGNIDLLQKEKKLLLIDISNKEKYLENIIVKINNLKDSLMLSKDKDKIISYLNRIKWVDVAKKTIDKLSTKPITILSKKVWENIVTDKFKKKFEEERKYLEAPEINFVFPGEYGETKREKTIQGLENIDDFLSEGEQKSIALADFLAEISLSEKVVPIVFDDPVTSFDHIRRRKIAERLVKESKNRQIIIFTHDILFLSYIYNDCRDTSDCSLFHWIEEDIDKLFGKISLNDCPMLDSYENKIKLVKESIQKAKLLIGNMKEKEIMNGYSILRSAYENYVIEKLFKKVVSRYEDRIRISRLKDIKFNPTALEEIQHKHEELSAYIEGHSHSDIVRQDSPKIEELEKELQYIESLNINKAIHKPNKEINKDN